MSSRTVTLEHALYTLALAIALGLRFFHLGALPLADFEADWALQALAIVDGEHPALGPNPAYLHLTAFLFVIFGASDFWARFWPALAGSALVLAPWFLRRRLGRVAALALAFGLALDPGLNALSRQAGGPMPAIACLALAIVFWLDGRRALAGLFGGLALLAGPSVWFGLFGLALGWGFSWLLPAPRPRTGEESGSAPGETEAGRRSATARLPGLRASLLWGLGTFLVVGTLLLFSPQGLAAFADSLLAFLRGWVTLSDVSLGRLLLAIPAYELLPLGFGAAGIIRGIVKKEAFSIKLGLWALAAFLLVLIYAGRQTAELGWLLLPLWMLAALEIGRHFDFEGRNPWVVGGTSGLIFIFFAITWLMMARLTTLDLSNPVYRWQWLILLIMPLVGAIVIILVGTGWTAAEARLGGVWGALFPLALFTLAAATGAAQIREPRTLELWNPEPRLGRADLLLKVADELSTLNTGHNASLPLTIAGVDSPALRWMFRGWEVEETNLLAPTAVPELVITPATVDLTLTADYRGAPFVWREAADWQQVTAAGWLKWFLYRQAPVLQEDIILWVRSDLLLSPPSQP
jgi:hypothetical protein